MGERTATNTARPAISYPTHSRTLHHSCRLFPHPVQLMERATPRTGKRVSFPCPSLHTFSPALNARSRHSVPFILGSIHIFRIGARAVFHSARKTYPELIFRACALTISHFTHPTFFFILRAPMLHTVHLLSPHYPVFPHRHLTQLTHINFFFPRFVFPGWCGSQDVRGVVYSCGIPRSQHNFSRGAFPKPFSRALRAPLFPRF